MNKPLTTRRLQDAKKEASAQVSASDYIPFAVHVTPTILKLRENGDLCATWRLHGTPFETASPQEIGDAKEQLINFLHAIRGTDQAEPTAVWQHRVRRVSQERLDREFPSAFASEVDRQYWEGLQSQQVIRNELYFTLVLRPTQGATAAVKRLRTRSAEALLEFQAETIERFEVLCSQVDASVAKYGGERLKTYTRRSPTGNEITYSAALSFYGYLLNGVMEEVAIQQGFINDYLCSSRIFAGDRNAVVQLNHPDRRTFVGYLDLMDYPERSEPGMNNCLFFGDYEFIETQSFSFLSKREGLDALKLQRNRLVSSGEGSEQQIADMELAMEDVRNGRVFMGEYHYTLGVHGDSVADVQRAMAQARSSLQEDAGYKVSSVDVIPECAHFAQLPGNWAWRPREAKITSRNFACMAPLHNFEMGKREGNPWGQAITMLATPSGQPFYFNWHESPLGKDSQGKKLPGNTFICGQTGAGKSALMGFLLAQSTAVPDLRILFFDKDRGGEIMIRAMGGRYRQLKRGQPTGFNPFQWPATPDNVAFVEQLVMQCARRGDDDVLDVQLENQLLNAVRKVFQLPAMESRRISAVLQFVGEDSELGQRLGKWCRTHAKQGANSWVLDNARDTTDFTGCSVFGFDYTEFLDDPECGPIILSYILKAADTLLNGQPFIYVMEEFAKMVAAKSQTLVEFARDKQTTIRKLNGLGVFVTQSPSQVNKYPIGSTLREQSVTQIFLPNPAADYADYVEGFKLTDAEFALLKSLALDSRMFLVKQGHRTALCRLDLGHMSDALEIISGTLDNVVLLDELRAQLGDAPAGWMGPFLSAIHQRNAASRKKAA